MVSTKTFVEQLAWRKKMLAIARTNNMPKLAAHHEREIRRLEAIIKKSQREV